MVKPKSESRLELPPSKEAQPGAAGAVSGIRYSEYHASVYVNADRASSNGSPNSIPVIDSWPGSPSISVKLPNFPLQRTTCVYWLPSWVHRKLT